MQFLYPGFLLALAALAIPIIIHLFYFRRYKKVYFTNVKFLKEVKEETSARNKLKNLLILLSRLLALAFLIFAFAQPVIRPDGDSGEGDGRAISLFVDNSFSMSSRSNQVPLLEEAKNNARQIVEAYAPDDEFQILTQDLEGRHQRLVNQEDALGLIDEIQISAVSRKMSNVLLRQKQTLDRASHSTKQAYLLSDFQSNFVDQERIVDTSMRIQLLPLNAIRQQNVSIDSCWFEAPVQMANQSNKLLVQISNLGNKEVDDVRINLSFDNQERPEGTISIPANSTVVDTINIPVLKTGWFRAKVSITDNPIQFDDHFFFAFNVKKEMNILAIHNAKPNGFITASFKNNPLLKVEQRSVSRLNYQEFQDQELIVLLDLKNLSSGLQLELENFVAGGGNLLIFPAEGADVGSYNAWLSSMRVNELQQYQKEDQEVGYLNTNEFVFRDVYENSRSNMTLPQVKGYYQLSQFNSRGEEVLMRFRNGKTNLGKYQFGKGRIFLSASPIDASVNNLVRTGSVFIPMVYKMALSTDNSRKIAHVIGRDEVLQTQNKISGAEMVFKMKGPEEFIPEQRAVGSDVILGLNNQIQTAGHYDLYLDPESVLEVFSFNYNRKESVLDFKSKAALSQLGETVDVLEVGKEMNLTQYIGQKQLGRAFWKWCIILCLLFLLIEILLIRLWKT